MLEWFFRKYNRVFIYIYIYIFCQYVIIENCRSEEKNITKDIRNLFSLKRELNYTVIKKIRNVLKLEKKPKAIKDRILRYIKNLFEHEEEKTIINH